MEISGGWHKVRLAIENVIDHTLSEKIDSFFEFDSILSVDEMNSLGYVRNFPHLTCLLCSINDRQHKSISRAERVFSAESVESDVKMALLPAACYKVYMTYGGMHLHEEQVVGCIARCFRNEDKALDDYRAINFTMKEVVYLGSADNAKRHLEIGLNNIATLLKKLKIPFTSEVATDPFFDADSGVAVLSKLMPTKREIMFEGHAVSSLNYHRNYFGEKFSIMLDGEPVNTSCVAFGIERWISMFKEVFGSPSTALSALAACDASASAVVS
jgi:seryl-tRNA synthetase